MSEVPQANLDAASEQMQSYSAALASMVNEHLAGLGESMEELFKTMQEHFEAVKNVRLARRKILLDEYHNLCLQIADLTREAEEMRANCRTLHITVEPLPGEVAMHAQGGGAAGVTE